MIATPLHDWLRPRLAALFAEAAAAGFPQEAVAAVLVDLATAAPFDSEPLPVQSELPGEAAP